MKRYMNPLLLVALMAGLAESAVAATVTFDFTNTNQTFTNGSHTFIGSDATSTVDVSAGNTGGSLTSHVAGSPWGLLVCTGGFPDAPRSSASCGSGTSDFHYIDGGSSGNSSDPDEFVSLQFADNVTLLHASFYSGSDGDFDLFVDGDKKLNEKTVRNNVYFSGLSGSELVFLADGSGDAFKLRTLTVDVSEVPVPAAFWLFGSALFGLFARARRQGQKS